MCIIKNINNDNKKSITIQLRTVNNNISLEQFKTNTSWIKEYIDDNITMF